jgi:hypothetical protein
LPERGCQLSSRVTLGRNFMHMTSVSFHHRRVSVARLATQLNNTAPS